MKRDLIIQRWAFVSMTPNTRSRRHRDLRTHTCAHMQTRADTGTCSYTDTRGHMQIHADMDTRKHAQAPADVCRYTLTHRHINTQGTHTQII